METGRCSHGCVTFFESPIALHFQAGFLSFAAPWLKLLRSSSPQPQSGCEPKDDGFSVQELFPKNF